MVVKISSIDKFSFENDVDFPFYNGIPKLSMTDWILLFLSFILFLTYFTLPIPLPDLFYEYSGVVLFVITILPVWYVIRDDVGLLFKKISKNDFKYIILCLIAYYVYALAMVFILGQLGFSVTPNTITGNNVYTVLSLVNIFIQLLAEELFKIIPFLILLYVFYSKTSNRKLSVILSTFIVLMMFGLIHYGAYAGNWAQMILIIGFGSIFEMILYIKTKNVTATYVLHLFIDFAVFLIIIGGIFGISFF